MSDDVHMIVGPLPPPQPWRPAGAGAVVTFEGAVRPVEEGRRLLALDYEQYAPMTEAEMIKLAHLIRGEFKLTALRCEHSVGRVNVNEVSFRLQVAAPHRPAALAATDAFVARMKQVVPIWKNPIFAEEA